MNAELTSLLQRCKEAPEDDVPRMVLADWLEEHGEGERAELVRLSVRLDAEEIDQGDEAATLARLHELYPRNAERWLGGLARRAGELCFRRGLLEVWCKADALGSLLADTPPHALPWLETLALDCFQQKHVEKLLESEEVAHFSALELTEVGLAPATLSRLGACPRLSHVRRLRLKLSPNARQKVIGPALARWALPGLRVLELDELGDVSLKALLAAPWAAELAVIDCGHLETAASVLADSPSAPRPLRLFVDLAKLGRRPLRSLFSRPSMGEVTHLYLDGSAAGLEGVGEALAGREWPRLRHLSLGGRLSERCAVLMAGAGGLGAVRRLDLWGATEGTLPTLLRARWFRGVRRLEGLRGVDIGDLPRRGELSPLRSLSVRWAKGADFRRLASAWPSLSALSLYEELTADDVRALAATPLAARLRYLRLSSGKGDVIGALAVPAFAGLTSLSLQHVALDKEGAEALARGPWRGLYRLQLVTCLDDESSAAPLLHPDALPQLTVLDVSSNGISNKTAEALVDGPRPRGLAQLSLVYDQRRSPRLWRLERPAAFPRQDWRSY